MRIYLDSCCLQRPHDDQRQPRIRVETEALYAVLSSVQNGELILLSSEALDFETSRIVDEGRRKEVTAVLGLAGEHLLISAESDALATELEARGIAALDAIHLALASSAVADFFCTCDDRLFRKASGMPNLRCRPITLLGFVPEGLK